MMDRLKEIYYVAWNDLMYMKHSIVDILVMSLMSPMLYLLAFGYGLGAGQVIDGVSYIAFIIPGIVALSSLSSSFSTTSARMNVQKLYYKSFDEMMLCPLRYSSIVLGKAMLGIIRGLLSCSIIFVIGLALTSELYLSPVFIVSLVISCFAFSLLGETAAILAKSHQSMATFSSLVILPMTFLCGTFFSISSMPEWFQAFLYVLPLTYSSTILRESALGWDVTWPFLGVLTVYAIVFYAVNVYLIKTRRV